MTAPKPHFPHVALASRKISQTPSCTSLRLNTRRDRQLSLTAAAPSYDWHQRHRHFRRRTGAPHGPRAARVESRRIRSAIARERHLVSHLSSVQREDEQRWLLARTDPRLDCEPLLLSAQDTDQGRSDPVELSRSRDTAPVGPTRPRS